jgi:hypothetical protein
LSGSALVGVGPVITNIGRTNRRNTIADLDSITKIRFGSAGNTFKCVGVNGTVDRIAGTKFGDITSSSIVHYDIVAAESKVGQKLIFRAVRMITTAVLWYIANSFSSTANGTSRRENFNTSSGWASSRGALMIEMNAVRIGYTLGGGFRGTNASRKIYCHFTYSRYCSFARGFVSTTAQFVTFTTVYASSEWAIMKLYRHRNSIDGYGIFQMSNFITLIKTKFFVILGRRIATSQSTRFRDSVISIREGGTATNPADGIVLAFFGAEGYFLGNCGERGDWRTRDAVGAVKTIFRVGDCDEEYQ